MGFHRVRSMIYSGPAEVGTMSRMGMELGCSCKEWTHFEHTHTKTRPTQNLGFTAFSGKLSFKRIHNNLSIELQNNLQLGEQIVSYI